MTYTPEQWLRANKLIRDRKEFPAPWNNAVATCADLLDEIADLRRQLENAKLSEGYALQTVANLHKEVAEARVERDQWRVDAKQLQSTLRVVEDENAELRVANNSLRNQRDEARAEIERLEKALEEIAESPGSTGEDAIDFKNSAWAALRREGERKVRREE